MSNISKNSKNFWKALEHISKLSEKERLELAKLLVTVDHGNENSETTYKVDKEVAIPQPPKPTETEKLQNLNCFLQNRNIEIFYVEFKRQS